MFVCYYFLNLLHDYEERNDSFLPRDAMLSAVWTRLFIQQDSKTDRETEYK